MVSPCGHTLNYAYSMFDRYRQPRSHSLGAEAPGILLWARSRWPLNPLDVVLGSCQLNRPTSPPTRSTAGVNRCMAHNAPGKHYRKGMTLVELIRKFPDDKTAEAWIASIRWPDGPECPHCGCGNVQHPTAHKTMPYRCRGKGCRKWFSVKTGTVMRESKLGYQVWAIAVYLYNTSLKSVSSMKLHRDLGISQKSAWHLAHRIRECWEDLSGEPMVGPVECDEAHFGGKARNMHAKVRRERITGVERWTRRRWSRRKTARRAGSPLRSWPTPTGRPCKGSSPSTPGQIRWSTPTSTAPMRGCPDTRPSGIPLRSM